MTFAKAIPHRWTPDIAERKAKAASSRATPKGGSAIKMIKAKRGGHRSEGKRDRQRLKEAARAEFADEHGKQRQPNRQRQAPLQRLRSIDDPERGEGGDDVEKCDPRSIGRCCV